ncbi:hypothetical protein ACW5R3_03435 [Bizionia sp. KMM 8389]
MFGRIPHKTKQFFFVLLKLCLVVAAFYFIYNKLTSNPDLEFQDFLHYLSENRIFSFKTIGFLLILSCLNWFFEILKWQVLVSTFKKNSILKATEQCLGSLTASLLTPNRIGEYGAKALYYKASERKYIVFLNTITNGLQMFVTSILGVIGLWAFVAKFNPEFHYHKSLFFFCFIILSFGIIALLFREKKWSFRGFSFEKAASYFKKIPLKTYNIGFLLALIRYAIFSFQFYFILTLFDSSLPYYQILICITSMYLLTSIIPSIFIFDVVIKGSFAVYLFSFLEIPALTVLSTVTLMWLLNVVLPSIVGSVYIIKFKQP